MSYSYEEIYQEGAESGARGLLMAMLRERFPREGAELEALVERCDGDDLSWLGLQAMHVRSVAALRRKFEARLAGRGAPAEAR